MQTRARQRRKEAETKEQGIENKKGRGRREKAKRMKRKMKSHSPWPHEHRAEAMNSTLYVQDVKGGPHIEEMPCIRCPRVDWNAPSAASAARQPSM